MYDFNRIIEIFGCLLVLSLICSCSTKKGVEKAVLPVYANKIPLNLDVESNELGILTYNIKAIGAKNKEETDALIEYVRKEEFSIILLQEVFSDKTRHQLIESLEQEYPHHVDRVDYPGFWRSICYNAGLTILSRYSMVDISSVNFGEKIENKGHFFHQILPKEVSLSLDFMSNKSILGTLIALPNNRSLLAFTTHTQALGSTKHKANQYRVIYEFIKKSIAELTLTGIIDPSKTAVILTGDLNTNAYWENQYGELLNHLKHPNDIHFLHNVEKEEYSFNATIFNMLFRFDYIFNYDRVGQYNMLPLEIKSAQVTDVRVDNKSISDHLPIISVLKY
ncbi:MAG: endonuclease/exonuclease/phosphatase family metal-dependent hydrolase [Saprospiraceae bacterium]|jgi:endonuclease/exonuclease/phosphatase family metal-dependent hydrolase